MDPTLIFDSATMSRVPEGTALAAVVLAVVASLLWRRNRARHERPNALTLWFVAAAVIVGAVSELSFVERRMIAERSDFHEVEGPVEGVWERRTVRTVGKNDYWNWQGFRLAGVDFAYILNLDSNYFNNTGPRPLALRDGLSLRVRYLEERDGDRMVRRIVRVSQVGPAALPHQLAAVAP